MKNSRSTDQLVFSHRSSFARISLYFIGILLCRLINAIPEFHFFEHRTSETWTSVGGWRRIVGWKFSREKEKIKWFKLSTESSLRYVHENRSVQMRSIASSVLSGIPRIYMYNRDKSDHSFRVFHLASTIVISVSLNMIIL